MRRKNFSLKNLFLCFLASVFVIAGILFFPLFNGSTKNTDAFITSPNAAKINEIYNSADDTFDYTNFTTLLKYISNSETITSKNLSPLTSLLNTTNITAGRIRGNQVAGKTANQEVIVRFGGLDWTPTYVSIANANDQGERDIILTLWLSNNEQEAWQNYSAYSKSGEYYGFAYSSATGRYGLYSDWSANWARDNTGFANPSAMYGASYLSVVTLNNGGYYAVDGGSASSYHNQDPNSVFALFTTGKLADYIVTPSLVRWQEYGQDVKSRFSWAYTLPNDNWSKSVKSGTVSGDPTGTNYSFNGNYNYASKDNSDQWIDDKLWIPSIIETGYSDSGKLNGLWETSAAQRQNYNGSSDSFSGTVVGTANGSDRTDYTCTWIRSATQNYAGQVYSLKANGADCRPDQVSQSHAVRPALHLNITKAAAKVKLPLLNELVDEYNANTPNDAKFKDIYKITSGEQVEYHIKTAEGLLKLSNYTDSEASFSSNWSFYLENDIDLASVASQFKFIGGVHNSFVGKFDGQNHTIICPHQNERYVDTGALFKNVGSCTIENLNLRVDMNGGTSFMCGLVYNIMDDENSEVHISHVNVDGRNYSTDYNATRSGLIGFSFTRDLYLYDINITMTEFGGGKRAFLLMDTLGGNLHLDGCNIICAKQTRGVKGLIGSTSGSPMTEINDLYISINSAATGGDASKKDFILTDGDINMTNSFIDLQVDQQISLLPYGKSIEIYDCAIVCNNIDITKATNSVNSENVYYAGFYIHNTSSSSTTIIDPNFTNDLWFSDGTTNHGLPLQRLFHWFGDILPAFDMREWAANG